MKEKLKPRLKKFCVNLGLLAIASCCGLLLCEWGVRMFLNPADYLSVGIVPDKVLGGVPSAAASSFDDWGFRNHGVPSSADIVAIGDSHTYGNTAKMDEAWPRVLQELTGKSVYNMGMGGYGPNQYYHLFKTKALGLKPRLVVCGLYMGDDFENAYLITYGLDHWAYLRQLPPSSVDFNIWRAKESPAWHKKYRVWLAEHSVVYKVVVHGPLLGRLKGDMQIQNAEKFYADATTLLVPEKNIREAFLPKGILMRLNQQDERIKEGMRITFELLKEMNDTCLTNNIQFVVAVIPTKEMVFSDYLEHNSKVHLHELIDKLLANERLAREATFRFFAESNIRYVDTLPALKGAVGRELYAHTAADMHPGKNGYRLIAESVCSEVDKKQRNK